MARGFKLTGNTEAKFKKLEEIIPRLMSRMSTKTYGIIPSSLVSFHKEVAMPDEPICRCGMFKGKLIKVLFLLDKLDTKLVPEYVITLQMGAEERKLKISTKKVFHIMEINADIPDGAVIEIVQITPEVILKNVYITALINFDQNKSNVKEYITEELIKDLENEGI